MTIRNGVIGSLETYPKFEEILNFYLNVCRFQGIQSDSFDQHCHVLFHHLSFPFTQPFTQHTELKYLENINITTPTPSPTPGYRQQNVFTFTIGICTVKH